MPGKIAIYVTTLGDVDTATAELDVAQVQLDRLSNLTAEEIAVQFPVAGDYDLALVAAAADLAAAQADLALAQGALADALNTLTKGGVLSENAMAELHAVLGL